MNAGVLTVAPQVSRESRVARVSKTLLGAALAVAVGAAPVLAEEGPGPGFSGHRARVASDITQRLAAAPGASSDVIVRGSPDVIHSLSDEVRTSREAFAEIGRGGRIDCRQPGRARG